MMLSVVGVTLRSNANIAFQCAYHVVWGTLLPVHPDAVPLTTGAGVVDWSLTYLHMP